MGYFSKYKKMLVLRKSCRPILIARSFCAPAVEAATSSVSGNKVEKKVQNVAKKTGEKKKKPKIRFPRQNVFDGMAALLENRVPKANFDETVEIAVNLGVDPRKPNQAVKGVATLPNGSGKKVRVGVFAKGADAQAATEAGADVVGAEDLIARVQSGDVPFDRVIATPELMSLVSKIGKVTLNFHSYFLYLLLFFRRFLDLSPSLCMSVVVHFIFTLL